LIAKDLKEFLDWRQDGFFYVGHSSALIRLAGKLVLFDPVWEHSPYGKFWQFVPRQVNCDEILSQVDHCIVSHIHGDHLCEKILGSLACPVSVMEGRAPLEARIQKVNSFVRKFPAFKWCPLDEKIEAYFVAHPFNTIDSSVFLRTKDFCVYLGSDNFLDEKTLFRVANDVPATDLAMIPYAFVHWYPHLLSNLFEEERELESKRLNAQSIGQALNFIRYLKPRRFVPFGNSLYYKGGANHVLNRTLATPYEIPRSSVMLAGDFLVHGLIFRKDAMERLLEESLGGSETPTDFVAYEPNWDNAVTLFSEKLKRATFSVSNHEIIIGELTFDLEKLEVRRGCTPAPGRNFTRFKVEPTQIWEWAQGKISFEEVIGTRKFTCERVPNEYNLKVFEFMNNFL
jgi:hypothetical protein